MNRWTVVFVLFASQRLWGEAIVINWSNSVAAASCSQLDLAKAGAYKWYFSHASVGEDICNGISSLRSFSPERYQIERLVEDTSPPLLTVAGGFYDYPRGNPSWQEKVDSFREYVSNGWHYPNIDIVMNKLCYIDAAADADYYISKMEALEEAFPQTLFVYFTMPLDTNEGSYNFRRNLFNNAVRSWVASNHRILYDIADIEAHDTNGIMQSFLHEGQAYQKMYGGYTTDGGHLNSMGRQRVAMGIYSLAIAICSADRDADAMPDLWERENMLHPMDPSDALLDGDNDGANNRDEYLSGTDPGDGASVLRAEIEFASPASLQISFVASSNVTYTVQACTNLSAQEWVAVAHISSKSYERAVFVIDTTTEADRARFYRVAALRDPM